MSAYQRPPIAPLEFRDATGNIINYGKRWSEFENLPEEAYSVFENLERFAPLQTVADTLIDFLRDHYEVDTEEGLQVATGIPHVPSTDGVTRAVRLTPRSALSAPITVLYTSDPGIRIVAGALLTADFPRCACNACDEIWTDSAEELEQTIFGIVAGGLSEWVSAPRRAKWHFDWGKGFVRGMGRSFSYELRLHDGATIERGESPAESVSSETLNAAVMTLEGVRAGSPRGNWIPWERR